MGAKFIQEPQLPPSLEAFFSRRRFLGLLGFASALPATRMLFSSVAPVSAASEKLDSISPVIGNRAPLAPSAFYMLPLGSIRPAGWLAPSFKSRPTALAATSAKPGPTSASTLAGSAAPANPGSAAPTISTASFR